MSKNLEVGSRLPFLEVRAGDRGELSGYGSVFNVRDLHGDVVLPGAFAASLKKRRPAMLWSHDQASVIGSWTRAVEDERGLFLEGRLNLQTEKGREAHASVKAGDVDGLSIGFSIPKDGAEWVEGGAGRRVKAAELFEVSLVAMPSNEAARVTETRALGSAVEIERLLSEFDNVPRRLAKKWARELWGDLQGKTAAEIEAEERAAAEAAAMAEIARELRAFEERFR